MKFLLTILLIASVAFTLGRCHKNTPQEMIEACISDGGEPDACAAAQTSQN